MQANLRDALPYPPEVLAGKVRRQFSAQAQGGAEGANAVIRQYDGVRSIERLTALAEEHVLPAIRRAPGLLGHRTLKSGEDQGRAAAVSVLAHRGSAMRPDDRVVRIVREWAKEVAPEPPRGTAGKTVVAATA